MMSRLSAWFEDVFFSFFSSASIRDIYPCYCYWYKILGYDSIAV